MRNTKKIRHWFRVFYHMNQNMFAIVLYSLSMIGVSMFVHDLSLKATLLLMISVYYVK